MRECEKDQGDECGFQTAFPDCFFRCVVASPSAPASLRLTEAAPLQRRQLQTQRVVKTVQRIVGNIY